MTACHVLANEDTSKIEVIEVTAQKRTQTINEIPISVSVFSSEQLRRLGIQDTTELANIVPGLNYSDTAFGPPVYTLRGVGFNESSAQATATVGIYMDQVAIPFPIMTKGANLDLERVEVLKGPQGTLFGRNATAGAINYIAAKPMSEFASGYSVSFANYQTFDVEGYVTGALSDGLNARAAVRAVRSYEGWQQSVSRHDTLGRQDKMSARVSVDWAIKENTQALLSVNYHEDASESLAPQAIDYIAAKAGNALNASFDVFGPILDPRVNPSLFPGNGSDIRAADWTADRRPRLAHDMLSLSVQVKHDISPALSFDSLSGFHRFNDQGSEYERGGAAGVTAGYIRNLTGGSLDTVFGGTLKDFYEGHLHGRNADLPDDTYVTSDYVFQHGDIQSFSQEFRITRTHESSIWVAGLYYNRSVVDYDTTQDWGLATNVNILPTSGFGFNSLENAIEQTTTSLAAFASVDWLFSDELTYTLGFRYSDDKAAYDGCTKDIDGAGLALFNQFFFGGGDSGGKVNDCVTVIDFGGQNQSVGNIDDTLDESSLSWRLAVNYQWRPSTSLFASYSRGFKAGSYPSLAAIVANQLDPVVQEQLDAYEIGVKTVLADNLAQLNVSAFYYDYKDKQLLTKKTIPVFRTAFTLGNIDKSYVQGLELDLQWFPIEDLYINAAVSVLKSKVTEGNGFNQLGQSLDLSGSPLPFTSEVQANLLARYEWDVQSNFRAFIAVDGAFTSEFSADFQADATTTNLVADFIGSPVEVFIPPEPYQYDERFTQPNYLLLNARVGLVNLENDWKVYAWVKNLTNEYYVSTVVKNNEMVAAYPGMTRTFGVTFEKRSF
ncbi:TonB-dependent receptor [Alteromonas sediminis]|nr:TonB-dependent receptor [Alteromonas sediminis]